MTNENQNISLAKLLQSLEEDCNPQERARILETLKNTQPTEEALLGAKMLLEDNNWDYTVLKKAFAKTTHRIEHIQNKSRKKYSAYLKYAAVLLPLTFVVGYFITTMAHNNQGIEQYYPKEEGLPNYMDTQQSNWDNLMELYRANKMKAAFAVSEEILTQKPQNDTAIYFHGVIGYELKNYKVAQSEYAKIAQQQQSAFYYDACFRLGFTLNKLKESKMAHHQFEAIAQDRNNPYSQKAKAVIASGL